jgi:uncharacterized protein (UPF0305 family)
MPELTYTNDEREMIDAMSIILTKYSELVDAVPVHSTGTDLIGRSSTFLQTLRDTIAEKDFEQLAGVGVLARLFR